MTAPVHLTSEGVSVVLAPSAHAPRILHWGASLGEGDLDGLVALQTAAVTHSALDAPRATSAVPDGASGFMGTPALEGYRPGGGTPWAPRLRWDLTASDSPGPVRLTGLDEESGWAVETTYELDRHGLLQTRTTVTNTGPGDLVLTRVVSALPVGAQATELLDLTGRWTRERSPQRHAWVHGKHVREARHGRTGHDATLLLVAGTPAFGFGRGEVWGVHVAWSGDHVSYAERTPEGDVLLGGGELLAPGEVVLAEGEGYTSPWLLASYAGDGLDTLSARFHGWIRDRSPRTRSERPVVLNTWEAVYFEHDLDTLDDLAVAGAAVGAERFVLDDGWFRGRRSDRAGLGDWTVDTDVWPEGLGPLIERVHAAGLDFGLWVEPEMVNLDSDLAREHPDWVLRGRADLPPEWRHQQVLDLQVPEAYAHVRDHLLALVGDYDIAYLKWDHNRDLIDVAHDGRPAVHGQTLAFYRLLEELRDAHPGLEIESCASGGGRVDLEVLQRTDRIWPSDTIDAIERQRIQRWTGLLVPPELVGSHVGSPRAHTTGRAQPLPFRAATALLSAFGMEWDVRDLNEWDAAMLRQWVDLHREIRPMMATARTVRLEHPDEAVVAHGLVTPERDLGYVVVAAVATLVDQQPDPLRLRDLDPAARYRVRCVTPPGGQHVMHLGGSWLDDPEGFVTTGAALMAAGVRLPVLPPETAQVLRVSAEA